ncbi:MAG: hypothetical protein H5T64_09290 [Chloroflexi bacterium]|nr:hypothetical protein [Chloroflexota bacterium]
MRSISPASFAQGWTRRIEWPLLVTLLLTSLAVLPLVTGGGMVNTRAGGDSPFLLVRTQQLVENLSRGIIPARWMPQAAYGLGYPFFHYYASLPYYLAAVLKLFGWGYIPAIQATQAVGFLGAALAMYILARQLWTHQILAALAALAYTYAPFHLVNVYVRGDSLSEFYAFVFYPLILYTLLCCQERPSAGAVGGLALSYAGLVLSHNISALIFSPFAILWGLYLILSAPKNRARVLAAMVVGAVLGLGLSAWFWLPALLERGIVHLEDMTTGYFHYEGHFRSLNLVQGSLLFDYRIDGEHTPFVLGLMQALATLFGGLAVTAAWLRSRHRDSRETLCLITCIVSTWMITPLSRPFWQNIPLLPLVQFPWRFLSVQACFAALLIAAGMRTLPRSGSVACVLALLLVLASLIGLRPERLLITEADVTPERLAWYEYFTANIGTTIRRDYLPTWVDPRPYTSAVLLNQGLKSTPLVLAGSLDAVEPAEVSPTLERWRVAAGAEGATIAFYTHYFPGWTATLDGEPAEISPVPSSGYISLGVPAGSHEVVLRFERTPLRTIAEGSTLLCLIVTLLFLVRSLVLNRWTLIRGLTGLVGLLVLVPLVSTTTVRTQGNTLLDLTWDFYRQPYLHHNPDGLRFGSAIRLRGYDLSTKMAQAGESFSLTLHWDGGTQDDLIAEVRLVTPAEHLLGIPDAVASSSEVITGQETTHVLPVPQETVRGLYLLALRVWDGQNEIQPVNEAGETLGTTYLHPVYVDGWVSAVGAGPPIAMYGERIALYGVTARQMSPEGLVITLKWGAITPVGENYKYSVRLLSPEGERLVAEDKQPRYGFYPTSLWRPGELVTDRVFLALPAGLSLGHDYQLEIVLYDAATLTAIGSVRVGGVTIEAVP